MEFPHMNDTKFPDIDTVNVYKYQNNFDYGRWTGKVSIKLVNVLWNSDYADVVSFDDDKKRDEWFDAQKGLIKTLESGFNITPDNYVKIPVPYNDAYRFNYLVVDMPMQTSVEEPIDYELESTRVSRWYYFIENMTQTAPSTTELQLKLDVWTTFSHTVEIPYLMLERGHAPMFSTTVESYLSNPIQNNEYLLADDFNYGETNIIRTSNYKPIGNGKKYVLFCMPVEYADFDKFDGTLYSGNATTPSYYDENSRWGYQLGVSDYEWKYANTDYTNADLPVANQIQDGIVNGCACYAIEGTQAKAFINECSNNYVHFIHAIKAFFILDESLFTKGTQVSFKGYTLYRVSSKHNVDNFIFDKSQFGFDSKYSEIAKLYTYPYSELEITDDSGNTFTARIENCGNVQIHNEISLVYPYLSYNVFFSGINGVGTMNYTWKQIDDTVETKTMWASDFQKYMMNWDIPTYSIFVNGQNEFSANNAADMRIRRLGAIKDYQNAVRYANTTRENTADTMQTNTDNVAASGATNTSNTQRSTSKDVANTNRDADLNNNIGARENSRDYALTNIMNDFLDSTTETSRNRLLNDSAVDAALIDAGVNAQVAQAALSIVGSSVSSIVSGGISGASSGGAAGAVIGAAGGAIGGIANGIQTAIGVGIDANYAAIQKQAMINKTLRLAGNTTYGAGGITEIRDANKDKNTDSMQENNDARYGTANSITQYRNDTMIANQAANKVANDSNASDIQSTNNANAVRTQNTETDNATYQRNANIEAAKGNLRQTQLNAYADYANNILHVPYEQGSYSGDMMQDAYERRGVRVNIRTQNDAAIAQAGDAMLRFGYALHRIWDMSNGFHYGKHFTYWRADDIWINEGTGLAGNAVNEIGDILMKGVTVWRNPDEIGKISIYDNI